MDKLGNLKLKDGIIENKERENHNMSRTNMEGTLDIKPIKEEMNKLIALEHEHNKRALNLVIFFLKEEVQEDTLAIV